MRRREGGAGPAPAGVVRSCTPGRTPEQPRRLLPGRLGSGHRGTRKREKPVARWTGAGSSWRLLWRATMSTEADHDLTRLMIAADEALYRAKAKGGDHVEPTLTLHVPRGRSRAAS